MLNASLLKFDSSGRISSLAVGDYPNPRFNGGTPTGELGSLVVGTTAPFVAHGGLLYTSPAGAVAVSNGGIIANHSQGGMPVTGSGLLCVEYGALPAWHVAGIPIAASGRVAVAAPTPPIVVTGFDTGFSNGFGAF